MGVNGLHQTTGSTEIWCIFRAEQSPEKRTCKCQNPSYSSLVDFSCQVDMEESFTLADTSFCSMKSTANMDQGELAEQLALVQEMVQEMKHGFSSAMEELAKIQFGDQKLQQQMVSEKDRHEQEVKDLTGAVNMLREEIKSFSTQLSKVNDTQKRLEEKVDGWEQSSRSYILEELERLGLSDKNSRSSPASGRKQPSHNSTKDVSPLVHPYLASLQQNGPDEDNQSVTALACKSLNMSQALLEKCLHLDMSVSTSDEEEAIRLSKMPVFPVAVKENSYFQEQFAQKKIPPHEQLIEEVQREKIAQEMVDAEKTYCSQMWNIIDGYMNTLRQEELMSSLELSEMFPPVIPHIYEQHCIMLRKMEERLIKWKYNGIMGDLYVRLTEPQNVDGLSLYKEYITQFPSIINSLNVWFIQSARFRDVMGSSSLASSSLVPLLVAPVQQIPKYALLIKNMLKYTSSDHPDRYYLESSLSRLKNFLSTNGDDIDRTIHFLNLGKPPIASRSRDSNNSVRSQSSGSSCEANRISSARDSGIHSNGEEINRHPASPAIDRRYMLQVLRDQRQRDRTGEHFHDRPSPVRPQAFGSHPDLTGQEYHDYYGNPRHMPAYMPYQNGQKMYSSLTKIPTNRSPDKSPDKPVRKIKIRKRQDSQKSLPSSNYLRPLTPHLPIGGLTTHSSFDDQAVPRKKNVSRRQMRPASSIDFSHADTERQQMFSNIYSKPENFSQMDSFQRGRHEFSPETSVRKESQQERLFQQSYLNSPRGQPGEGRARNDLHMSVQKLKAEQLKAEQPRHEEDHPYVNDPPFRPLASSSVLERREVVNRPPPKAPSKSTELAQIDDFGIFGDDDEDEEEDDYEYDDDYRNKEHSLDKMEADSQNRVNGSDSSSPEPVIVESETNVPVSRSKVYQVDSDIDDQPESQSGDLTGSKNNEEHSGRSDAEKSSLEDKEIRNSKMKPENLVPLKPERRKTVATTNALDINSNDTDTTRRLSLGKVSRNSDIEKSEMTQSQLIVSSVDSDGRNPRPLSLKARQMDASNVPAPKEATFSPLQMRNREGAPRKLPQVNGRYSVPVFDSNYGNKQMSSPPQSPTDTKSTKPSSKDTKIPVYSPMKKKGDKSAGDNMSRSTEDVSKLKKKTHLKDSIKSFFGRKRPGHGDESGTLEFEDRQIQV